MRSLMMWSEGQGGGVGRGRFLLLSVFFFLSRIRTVCFYNATECVCVCVFYVVWEHNGRTQPALGDVLLLCDFFYVQRLFAPLVDCAVIHVDTLNPPPPPPPPSPKFAAGCPPPLSPLSSLRRRLRLVEDRKYPCCAVNTSCRKTTERSGCNTCACGQQ